MKTFFLFLIILSLSKALSYSTLAVTPPVEIPSFAFQGNHNPIPAGMTGQVVPISSTDLMVCAGVQNPNNVRNS